MSKNRRGTFSQHKLNAIKDGALYPRLRTFMKHEVNPILQKIKKRKQMMRLEKH